MEFNIAEPVDRTIAEIIETVLEAANPVVGEGIFGTGSDRPTGDVLTRVQTDAFKQVGIDDWKPYVRQNPEFMRPAEVDILLGNPAKAEKVLGWQREVDFEGLVKMMVDYDLGVEADSPAV